MESASYDSFLKGVNPFHRKIPKTRFLLLGMLIASVIVGMIAALLINHSTAAADSGYIILNGAIAGILALMLPTLLTIIFVKSIRRYIDTKYVAFVSLIGFVAYSFFVLLGSVLFVFTGSYNLANVVILVGDASIFGWWFFVNKMMLGQRKRAVLFAVVQPILNIVLFIPGGRDIISFSGPFSTLLVKLFAGMFIFMLVGYTIMYVLDRPMRKRGFHGIDAFSQMLQNWLFDINISAPFGGKFGKLQSIETDTVLFRTVNGKMKAIMFIPDIHYGPSGTLGGSSFPYLLERYVYAKYGVPGFIMHCAVNMDHNPISSSQIGRLKEALDNGVATAKGGSAAGVSFSKSSYRNSTITRLGLGPVSLFTLTRAPRITEDVAPEAAAVLKKELVSTFGPSVLVDAHNSRYEDAPQAELDGVAINSVYVDNYLGAIRRLRGTSAGARVLKMGIASEDIYYRLKHPLDIAKGNLNVAVFDTGKQRYAIIQFNSNNMSPQFRRQVIAHVAKAYRLDAELYTSDTHAVNSIGFDAENVLGTYTRAKEMLPFVDKAIAKALSNMEQVRAYHASEEMKNFKVWGPNAMEKILALSTGIYKIARTVVPFIITVGFLAATWAVLVV
ncbi:MAG: DUF2070 family protein [Candidatus Micrarchaeota archaeon]|nr:DUF2070 family protein [Candidatus Micrarchaeota archaeon]